MTYLLDTCALIKAAVEGEEALGRRAARVMRDQRNDLLLSTVSVAELHYLILRGRLQMTTALLGKAIADLKIRLIPFKESHANRCFDLPFPPRDPMDRMIIATALSENVPVISSDEVFRLCADLKVIWN